MIQQNDQTTTAVIQRGTGDDRQCLDTIWGFIPKNILYSFPLINSSTMQSQVNVNSLIEIWSKIELMIQDD